MDEGREQNQQNDAREILGTTELPKTPRFTLHENGVVILETDDPLDALAATGSVREH